MLGAGIMKKFNKCAGLALAFSMLVSMTACKKSSSETETTASSEKENTTQASTEETTTEDTTTEETTEESTSEETSDPSDTTASDPEKDFEEDLYNFYASSKHEFPGRLYGAERGYDSYRDWTQQVGINLETWIMTGYYTADGKEFKCKFKVAPVERVNDYSYRTTILETIDYNPDDFEDPFEFATPPYSFSEGDELIVFLPNAPLSEVPPTVQMAAEQTASSRKHPKDGRLQSYVIYNEASDHAYDGDSTMLPVYASTKLNEDEMESWSGDYKESSGAETGELKIYKDPSSGEIRADYYCSDYEQTVKKWFRNLSVRIEVDNPNAIYAFGEADDGTFTIILIERVEETGRYQLRILAYTPDDEYMAGLGFDFEKTN